MKSAAFENTVINIQNSRLRINSEAGNRRILLSTSLEGSENTLHFEGEPVSAMGFDEQSPPFHLSYSQRICSKAFISKFSCRLQIIASKLLPGKVQKSFVTALTTDYLIPMSKGRILAAKKVFFSTCVLIMEVDQSSIQ